MVIIPTPSLLHTYTTSVLWCRKRIALRETCNQIAWGFHCLPFYLHEPSQTDMNFTPRVRSIYFFPAMDFSCCLVCSRHKVPHIPWSDEHDYEVTAQKYIIFTIHLFSKILFGSWGCWNLSQLLLGEDGAHPGHNHTHSYQNLGTIWYNQLTINSLSWHPVSPLGVMELLQPVAATVGLRLGTTLAVFHKAAQPHTHTHIHI